MTLKNFLSTVLVLFIFVGISQSATILIPNDYGTIQGGIDASVDGDTILVSAGTYNEQLDYLGKAISVVSKDGPHKTTLTTNSNIVNMSNIQSGTSTLSGFSIMGFRSLVNGSFIHNKIDVQNSVDVVIQNNIFHHFGCIDSGNDIYYTYLCGNAIYANNSKVTIKNNFIYNSDIEAQSGVIKLDTNCTNSMITNNTFYQTNQPIRINSENTIVKNNIFVENSQYCILVESNVQVIDADYNLYSNNNTQYNDYADNLQYYDNISVGGQNDLNNDPLFYQINTPLPYITPLSPCIDAGDPNPVFNDPDNSRNDIGAVPFGIVPSAPPTNVQVSDIFFNGNIANLTSLTPTISWSPPTGVTPEDSIQYQVLVNLYSNNNNPAPTYDTVAQIIDTLHGNTVCHFRVIATNKYGLQSDESEEVLGYTWRLGDITIDGLTDISDLVILVDFMFNNGTPFMFPERGDFNADCQIDITDLIMFVDVLFNGKVPGTLEYGCK